MTTCRIEHDGTICGARTANAQICAKHTGWLRDTLRELPDLLRELETTITRQDRGTAAPLYAVRKGRVQVPGVHYEEGDNTLPSTQWPLSWDAANTRWNVLNTVVTWARHIAETHQLELTGSASGFLLAHLTEIRADEAAVECWDEIRAAAREVRQAIDRQEPDLFAGRCEAMVMTTTNIDGVLIPELAPCSTDLLARTGDDDVRCPACGTVYDLVEQRVKMTAMLPDIIAPTTDIANALTSLSQPVTPSMIRQMAHRKEIIARGVEPKSSSMLYRVGDVMDVLARRAERAASRGLKPKGPKGKIAG